MLGSTYQVKWQFQCGYVRDNGFRVSEHAPTTTLPDTFTIPTVGSFVTLAGDALWKIYGDPAWNTDFFGGDCTVVYPTVLAA